MVLLDREILTLLLVPVPVIVKPSPIEETSKIVDPPSGVVCNDSVILVTLAADVTVKASLLVA